MPILPPNNNGAPHLSARLSAVADSLMKGGVVCDVGSDHAALPCFLLKNGLCSGAIVTDLRPAPLARAKAALCREKLDDKAVFVLTDGIEEILPLSPDSIVIAGMGGETIAGILSRALDGLPLGQAFVLQPMTHPELLRRYLYENGFRAVNETLVWDSGKPYLVFRAQFDGICRKKDDLFYAVGAFLPRQNSPEAMAYFNYLARRVRTRLNGKKKAGLDCEAEKSLLALLERLQKEKS